MEAYHANEPWRLTKLYTDAKKSYTSASPPMNSNEAPEILSLHRKFRIQKDRLVAWGLEWTDDGSRSKDAKGNIDESIERAGLTEVVSSVMENIKGILDEVDALRARTAPRKVNVAVTATSVIYPPDKPSTTGVWTTSDKAHYEDLVTDLTRAIDLLCDLSKHKRVSRPSSPTASTTGKEPLDASAWDSATVIAPTVNPYEDLPPTRKSGPLAVPRIDLVALALPEEGPPPYNAIVNIRPSRTIGRLRHHVTSNVAGGKRPKLEEASIPIMIEDACFDSIYKNSTIPLPMTRLDQLYSVSRLHETSSTCAALPKLIGCFEYPSEPRYGLVYELPSAVHSTTYKSGDIQNGGPIVSLYQLLESASKLQPNAGSTASTAIPPLEERFRLALELVTSFAELQRNSFTHQGFSSSSVALFPRPQNAASPPTAGRTIEYNVRRPLITSFDVFSEYNIDSPPEMLHENLYRHPDDPRMKGPSAAENFNPNFDLYSLGLVLLEIGLWHPLSDIFKEKYSLKDFQTRIEKIWIRRLAGRCGTAYMRAVQDCISFGNESSLSEDALAQAYGRVKTRLHRCCLLDDEVGDIDTIIEREPGRSPVEGSLSPAMTRLDSGLSWPRQGTNMSSSGTLRKETSSPTKFNDTKVEPSREIFQEPTSFTEPEKVVQENAGEQSETKKPRYRFPDKTLPAEILDIWNNALEPRLARIVSKALQNSRESCEIFVCYTGENETAAKPTACVMCSSTKLVRAAVRRFFKYDKDEFDVAVLKGKIVRSKAVRRPANSVRRAASSNTSCSQAMNPFHHQRPLCGASIGAFRDSEHMPPVSFGGVVVVDGHQYGMSVHHLIEDPEEDEFDDDDNDSDLPMRAMDRGPRPPRTQQAESAHEPYFESAEAFDESDEEDASDLDSIFGTSSESVDFDDMASEFSFPGAEVDDDPENGDTDGVMVGDGEEIIITQPALNDVAEDFFPCEEDKDDDHLDSHSLGHVHASSGLRRRNDHGIEHEVDWALLKLHSDRVQTHNLIAGGRRYCRSDSATAFRPKLLEPICRREFPASEDLYPRHIASSEQLSGLEVHCFGRTSGLKQGRISQMMRLVRFHGRRTFSRTWSVTGDFGVGGDSGAWVVDNQHGRVCGHVLAWSSTLGTAYISPMDVMFEDIRRTLQARTVSLPGGEDQTDDTEVGHQSEDEVLEGVDPSVTAAVSTTQVEAELNNLAIKDSSTTTTTTTTTSSSSPSSKGGAIVTTTSSSPYLLAAHHVMLTGTGTANPDRIEREWTSRRSMLGGMENHPTTIA